MCVQLCLLLSNVRHPGSLATLSVARNAKLASKQELGRCYLFSSRVGRGKEKLPALRYKNQWESRGEGRIFWWRNFDWGYGVPSLRACVVVSRGYLNRVYCLQVWLLLQWSSYTRIRVIFSQKSCVGKRAIRSQESSLCSIRVLGATSCISFQHRKKVE